MLSKSLIEVRHFPAVIQAAHIADLRLHKNDDALRDFIGGYLGFDEYAGHALSTSLSLLASPRGGAFFLNGVFGSGKSHLLGLLTLLCDGLGHEYFLQSHPHFASLLRTLPEYFCIHFSLDEYSATDFSLEEIVRREIENEWQNHFDEKWEWPDSGTRGEYFLSLEEQLQSRGYSALFIGIDELSLFLSAKEHRALQADAAFLQFLGQRAARSTPCPLHVFAALQKTVEDIGDLEAYSLSQIRDRFQTLRLSLAHIPSLIERRLIIRKDESTLQTICRESYDQLQKALPRLDFGREEWQQLYPFHPATIALLESVVLRFFSRTRSAALFCAHAAMEHLESNAAVSRVLPDALFDYLCSELDSHPDLRSLAGVWSAWQENLPELCSDEHDAIALQRLMKTLLLFKIAGNAPTVLQLANAVSLDANLGGERNYEYAQVLLERLRTRGSFLAVERNKGAWQDRYAIDLGTRVSELARRQIRSALQELQPRDARIAATVLRCCNREPLPLASLSTPRSFSILWRNAPREIGVELWTQKFAASQFANRVAMLPQIGAREELLLFIAPPFGEDTPTLPPPLLEERWQNAVLLWTPRVPTDSEWQLAREATAAQLLEDDPQLLDNRRGRAILNHIKENASGRETQLAQLATRLLREGQIVAASGISIEASELAAGESWTSTLEAMAEFALPRVFPHFEEIAPRLKVLTSSNADTLCLEILRRPATEPYFAASHERLVRALAEPLGIAKADKGRWQIVPPRADLTQEILSLSQSESTLSALDAHFSKSDWGLKPEQLAITVCAMLRSGELAALDARGQVLPPSQIGMPLRRAVHAVRPGHLLNEAEWARLQSLLKILTVEKLRARSFEEQERARVLLLRWQDETRSQIELATARLNQLRRALNAASAPWPESESTLTGVAQLADDFSPSRLDELLPRAANLDAGNAQQLMEAWRTLTTQLDARQSVLISTAALLFHPELSTPPNLQSARHELLLKLQSGEEILADDTLLQQAAQWRQEYSQEYQAWHQSQNSSARWNSLRRILNSDELRALERLGKIRTRDFSQFHSIRQQLQSELEKQCPRDGVLLPGEATCNACRLKLGTRVLLRDAGEIESFIAQQLSAFAQILEEPGTREYLSRDEKARELLHWKPDENLLPLLSDEVLRLLEDAFKPRRRVTRSIQELSAQLKNCRTRAEFETAFSRWLDADENLSSDDEVEIKD